LECNSQQPWNATTADNLLVLTYRPADLGCVESVAALQVVENVTTFVNILRAAGHSDENIQGVFDGWPLCWTTKELWDEFRHALGKRRTRRQTKHVCLPNHRRTYTQKPYYCGLVGWLVGGFGGSMVG
jgi:hypothetical protein